ncbi:MAG: hypothetical protein QOI48_2348 [Solirubrobacteraceae bacterium]|jgi:hypothetical protein|nr:hypothetical protein [Solirubrobacteraceae bacterium]
MRGLLLPVLVASLAATASPAHAAASIEGTWSYQGGQVVVAPTGPEEYQGTVVRKIKSTPCSHKTGEVIWAINDSGETDLYRGGQTFRDPAGCAIAPLRGFARWTVSADSAELCFVAPEDDESPPTCETITRLARARSPATFADTVILPSDRRCRSRRTLRIQLRQPRGDAVVAAEVRVNRKLVASVPRRRIGLPITLRGLPKGRYTVQITLQTATKLTIRGSRRYRRCG